VVIRPPPLPAVAALLVSLAGADHEVVALLLSDQ
jgi:hypothetical protein